MLRKNALAAVFLAMLLGAALPAPAVGGQAPPLEGVFGENFTLLDPPVPAPLGTFQDLDGRAVRLADFKGSLVVLNFWATWCAPCIREMPSLDRLQAALGGRGLRVVAVSIDRGGAKVVVPFAEKLGLAHLGLYLDPKATLARAFGLTGLPTTYLIDAEGRTVGGLSGPAEWDAPEARALIEHYLDARPGAAEAADRTSKGQDGS